MANPFEGLKSARPSINRYIRSGHYLARIDAVKLAKNRTDGDIFAIEMTNVYTFPDGEAPRGGQPPHSVGEAFSEVISRAGSKDMYLPRIKGFIMSVLNATEDQVDENVALQVTDGAVQPLKGLVIELVGKNAKTKVNQKDIVRIDWAGQVPVVRLRSVVPAAVLTQSFDEAALTALEARQKGMGVG